VTSGWRVAWRIAALFGLGLLATPTASAAGDPPQDTAAAHSAQPQAAPRWHFQVMPYLWLSGVDGAIRPLAGAPTLTVLRSASDVLRDVDSAYFVSGAAQRGRVLILADASRTAWSRAGTVPPGVPAQGGMTQRSLALAFGYAVREGRRLNLHLIGGVRAFSADGEVTALGVTFRSPREQFVDPIVGARLGVALAPRWSVLLHADGGGFDVGSKRDLMLSGAVNYAVANHITLSGGWRTLALDYRAGQTRLDATFSGLLAGLSVRL
jgi:hypothetical protein